MVASMRLPASSPDWMLKSDEQHHWLKRTNSSTHGSKPFRRLMAFDAKSGPPMRPISLCPKSIRWRVAITQFIVSTEDKSSLSARSTRTCSARPAHAKPEVEDRPAGRWTKLSYLHVGPAEIQLTRSPAQGHFRMLPQRQQPRREAARQFLQTVSLLPHLSIWGPEPRLSRCLLTRLEAASRR